MLAPFSTYTPFAELARTRTSTLYLARAGDRRLVVVRRFDPQWVDDTGRWLLQSTASLRASDHRHWARLLAFEQHGGHCSWVIEYLHATSLHHTLICTRAALPYALAAAILLRAAQGAHAAHAMTLPDGRPARFVHRRITPRTLYVGWDGSVKLMPYATALTPTSADDPYEFLPYMAPEQVAGEEIDVRCDVHALGLLLYELTVGHTPFAREHALDTLEALQAHQLPAPPWCEDYPVALEAIVRRALATRRDERHSNAGELALELERWLFEAGHETHETDIAAYVTPLHGAEIRRRRELLSGNP